MATQRYSVTPHPVETLLTWVKSGEIAIPEIQRPFVWSPKQVRDLLDSLYNGFPIGYLIAWRNPTIKLKDGSISAGKRILIDGQQRVTALMASLLGNEVMNKDYKTVNIKIAFHPIKEIFEVSNPAIAKDSTWIEDITSIFTQDANLFGLVDKYKDSNPSIDHKVIESNFQKVLKIVHNQVGLIELAEDLDIEVITEIFIRVNSKGTVLSQADFVMSKIAVNEIYGGNELRRAIDYFCHLSNAPENFMTIAKQDTNFTQSTFWEKMKWLKNTNDHLYIPTYTDMLRVAFTSEFNRGRLDELVALISGRNFDTKEYEEAIIDSSFTYLKRGIINFIDQTNFERFTMIIRSCGFITSSLIRSHNAINFAYILYLSSRRQELPPHEIERVVCRWYAMSVLTGRYSGSPETIFDTDIRQINKQGVTSYTKLVIENELPSTFWTGLLPQQMTTSSVISPFFLVYQAAQSYLGDKGFLSTDITVRDLLLNRGDRHHIFPRKYLQKKGLSRGQYNQIANYVIAQNEINIAISDKPPGKYFGELLDQCDGGDKRYGGITDINILLNNLRANCIPDEMLLDTPYSYDHFLDKRRHLMAEKIKDWFHKL